MPIFKKETESSDPSIRKEGWKKVYKVRKDKLLVTTRNRTPEERSRINKVAREARAARKVIPKYTNRTPESASASSLALRLKKKGLLKPEPCYVCGSDRHLRINHCSYIPGDIDIVWLCAVCLRRHKLQPNPQFCLLPKCRNNNNVKNLLIEP